MCCVCPVGELTDETQSNIQAALSRSRTCQDRELAGVPRLYASLPLPPFTCLFFDPWKDLHTPPPTKRQTPYCSGAGVGVVLWSCNHSPEPPCDRLRSLLVGTLLFNTGQRASGGFLLQRLVSFRTQTTVYLVLLSFVLTPDMSWQRAACFHTRPIATRFCWIVCLGKTNCDKWGHLRRVNFADTTIQ